MIAGRWLGDGWRTLVVLEHQIKHIPSGQQQNQTEHIKTIANSLGGWLLLFQAKLVYIYFAKRWLGDGWEMAGWLSLAICKDCGCNCKSLQDGWEMTRWLAPTSSKYVGCNCRSPRDDWEMVGWLAQAISKDFGCRSESLRDGWENTCCIRTPSTKQTHNQYNNNTYSTDKTQT